MDAFDATTLVFGCLMFVGVGQLLELGEFWIALLVAAMAAGVVYHSVYRKVGRGVPEVPRG